MHWYVKQRQQLIFLGWQTPDQPNSDYEFWIPSDREGDECLLGRTIKYTRRKQASKCFNPVSFKQTTATTVRNCSCTDENYEWYAKEVIFS